MPPFDDLQSEGERRDGPMTLARVKAAIERQLAQRGPDAEDNRMWIDALTEVLIVERNAKTATEKFLVAMREKAAA